MPKKDCRPMSETTEKQDKKPHQKTEAKNRTMAIAGAIT